MRYQILLYIKGALKLDVELRRKPTKNDSRDMTKGGRGYQYQARKQDFK